MSAFMSLVKPWLGGKVLAGNCLAMAQMVVGAPGSLKSATVAADATESRHATRTMPDAVCVVWFDHWGKYGPAGREYFDNWGHVVVWVPGVGFVSSSPRAGKTEGPFIYGSLAEVERTFNATFRFWSQDLNGKQICEPATTSSADGPEEDDMAQNAGFTTKIKGIRYDAIVNTTSGFFHAWQGGDGGMATAVGQSFGCPANFAAITESHWNKLAADCAAVRAGK